MGFFRYIDAHPEILGIFNFSKIPRISMENSRKPEKFRKLGLKPLLSNLRTTDVVYGMSYSTLKSEEEKKLKASQYVPIAKKSQVPKKKTAPKRKTSKGRRS